MGRRGTEKLGGGGGFTDCKDSRRLLEVGRRGMEGEGEDGSMVPETSLSASSMTDESSRIECEFISSAVKL